MLAYRCPIQPFAGTDYREIHGAAETLYRQIKARSKRRPYVRSAYFKKEKVFLDIFWQHLHQKNWRDRVRRLKYLPCAIELMRRSREKPTTKASPHRSTVLFYRFAGITREGQRFFVQIRESTRSKQKVLLSVFPEQ